MPVAVTLIIFGGGNIKSRLRSQGPRSGGRLYSTASTPHHRNARESEKQHPFLSLSLSLSLSVYVSLCLSVSLASHLDQPHVLKQHPRHLWQLRHLRWRVPVQELLLRGLVRAEPVLCPAAHARAHGARHRLPQRPRRPCRGRQGAHSPSQGWSRPDGESLGSG
jgi:hypothetical protein